MYLQGVVIFCLSIVQPFLCYEKMDMSDDPILQFLKMDPNSVIEHELVEVSFPERLHKREIHLYQDEKHVKVRAFGNDINLWLHPRDSMLSTVLTDVYTAHYAADRLPSRVRFEKIANAMVDVGRLFEANRTYLASLVIGTDDLSNWTINGIIKLRGDNKRVVVRSLPEDVVHRYLRKRRSTVGINNRSSNMSYHVALKFNDDPPNEKPLQSINEMSAAISSDQVPDVVDEDTDTLYPEILLYIDSTFQTDWSNDLTPFLAYLLAFWNGVDLVFRSIENPKVRLHISKIVLGVEPLSTPYIFNSMYPRNNSFHNNWALNRSSEFFYAIQDDFSFLDYDFAITMTKFMMGRARYDFYDVGISNVRGACQHDDTNKTMDAVAIIREYGDFASINVAAHELGHLMGMGDDDTNLIGNCSYENGLLMASNNMYLTVNATSFSECSLNDLQASINASRLTCLYNVPQNSDPHGEFLKLMPGRMISLANQCYYHNMGPPCVPPLNTDICLQLHCAMNENYKDADSDDLCFGLPYGAVTGTPCGNHTDPKPRFCLQSRCVSL